jgi:hypothetical protein
MDDKPDPRRIHQLEYELGFRDDPPLIEGFTRLHLTDAPGTIIDYDPRLLSSPAGRMALEREIADAQNPGMEQLRAPMPLTPALMLASWSYRRAALRLGLPLVPLIRLLPRDARLMAMNVCALAWARYVVIRWHELNPSPPIFWVPEEDSAVVS